VQASRATGRCTRVAGCTLAPGHADDCIIRNADGTGTAVAPPKETT